MKLRVRRAIMFPQGLKALAWGTSRQLFESFGFILTGSSLASPWPWRLCVASVSASNYLSWMALKTPRRWKCQGLR